MDKLPQAYNQTIKAIYLGIRVCEKKVIYHYEDYKISDLFEYIPCQDLLNFCHPVALEILRYDENNHTDYLDTLTAYFANGKDSSTTAATLHLHRNTVLYRIDSIAKLFKIDMSDGDLIFQLVLSMKILNYMKLFKAPDWKRLQISENKVTQSLM